MEKQCTSCKITAPIEQFSKAKRRYDGYDNLCKTCRNIVNKTYRDKNSMVFKEARKRYYQANIDKMRAEKRVYYSQNKEAKSQYDKIYRQKNKDKINEYKRVWDLTDREKIHSRIKKNLRRRLIHAIKGKNKSGSTMNLLGCDIDFLIRHLESKFDEKMNWANYGQFGWHIDHIIPCSSFDLTSLEEQKKCFNYNNLQPLWWNENLSKSKKINYGKETN